MVLCPIQRMQRVTYQEGVCQSNDVTVIVYAFQSPSISLTKIANLTNYSTVGQNIAYTYTVKNTGNVDIKEHIIVEDDKFGTIFVQSISILSPSSSAQNIYLQNNRGRHLCGFCEHFSICKKFIQQPTNNFE
jgi:uncharacterized repeat protein (TIGR01451 family)